MRAASPNTHHRKAWIRPGSFSLIAFVAAVTLAMSASGNAPGLHNAAQSAPGAASDCALETEAPRAVVRVIDSETLALDDGSVVRLIGALAPRAPVTTPEPTSWPPQDAAAAALTALVGGASLELAVAGKGRDRYGRLLAHAFLRRGAQRIWVQAHMVSLGHARVYGLPGHYHCAQELLAHERAAATLRKGLWASAAYQIRQAARTRELARLRSTFQLVEGRIARISKAGALTYLNFGTDWRSDFTVAISRETAAAHRDWASGLARLQGALVRVRGWIERRNGPYIELRDPSELEIIEDAGVPARALGDQ